jgi:uncharacterized protein (TIGR02231 family)
MRIKAGLFYILFVVNNIYADIQLRPQIKEVELYTSSAEITSSAKANIVKGTYNLIFENVSPFIDENSIQIKGNADLSILSISVNKDFLNEKNKDAGLKKLEDSLMVLNKRLSLVNNKQSAFNEALTFLKTNQKLPTGNVAISALEIEKMANLYEISLQENKLQEKLNAIQNQINGYNLENSNDLSDIIVNVKSNTVGEVDLTLSYVVSNAGWTPSYDIRTEGIASSIQLLAKANVWQRTGENWKDVKLLISTGNPSRSNQVPTFTPSYVVLYPEYQPRKKTAHQARSDNAPAAMQFASPQMKGLNDLEQEEGFTATNITSIETATNNVFETSIPYSIKSDGKVNSVEIQKYSIKATYNYITRPKQDMSVFLVAQITDWNQSGLLSGEANVYFEGNYVGKSFFDASSTMDTLSFSFGRDNNISIQRKRVKFLNDKSIVGNTKSLEVGYEISVKNKKKTDVELVIEDQIPISQNTNTSIEVLELTKANYDLETGKLKWSTTIKPNEGKSFRFEFRVKYPKGNVIQTDF